MSFHQMHQRQKPQRPYATLEAFRKCYRFTSKNIDWPCLSCDGHGWIYDPHDEPCPIEGNKMRNRLKCQACTNTGIGNQKAFREEYAKLIREWKGRLAAWKHDMRIWKSLRLTKEQVGVIHRFGTPNPKD